MPAIDIIAALFDLPSRGTEARRAVDNRHRAGAPDRHVCRACRSAAEHGGGRARFSGATGRRCFMPAISSRICATTPNSTAFVATAERVTKAVFRPEPQLTTPYRYRRAQMISDPVPESPKPLAPDALLRSGPASPSRAARQDGLLFTCGERGTGRSRSGCLQAGGGSGAH